MSRKNARDTLFRLVFELCFVKPEDTSSYENFLLDNKFSDDNLGFIKTNFEGIVNNFSQLTQMLQKHIKGYTLDRLYKVDYAILLTAFYELGFYKQTPSEVVVNEAVNLAKKYSTDKSFSFINAVLADYLKTLQG